jgi:hypothetical protein
MPAARSQAARTFALALSAFSAYLPVIGEAYATEQQIFRAEILLYKSSTRRKKLAVKQVPVIGEAYATEQQIFRAEI